jgi:hypothetical protein
MSPISYVAPFMIGGCTVAGIKLASNYVSPPVAAVIGAAPIGLLSTFYIEETRKLVGYLQNYQITLTLIICVSALYRVLLAAEFQHHTSLGIVVATYITLVVAKLLLFGGTASTASQKAV